MMMMRKYNVLHAEFRKAENQKTTAKMEKLHKLLEEHDFYYMYSDSYDIYAQGKDEFLEIQELIKEIGPEGEEAYKSYDKS